MKYPILIFILASLISCKTEPYLKHSMKFEKISGECADISNKFKMNSNINGERFEIQRCLDTDFQKAQLRSIRQGDTVVLKFERKNTKQALYNIIVDVDSYPRYNFLTIDGDTFIIVPSSGQ